MAFNKNLYMLVSQQIYTKRLKIAVNKKSPDSIGALFYCVSSERETGVPD
jgi:hypothetical protein